MDGDTTWQEIAVFPFWYTEGIIRQLRFDVYSGAHFDIDWIRILERDLSEPPDSIGIWNLGGDTSRWQIDAGASELFAPPVKIDVRDKGWVTVQLSSDREGTASILWAREHAAGLKAEAFSVKGDGKLHTYNLSMTGNPAWRDTIIAFGIRPPRESKVWLESIHIGKEPSGPGELEVCYFGFENGINRCGRPCRILA